MKDFNLLSKSSSQSCGHSSVTLAMTVGSPSAHRRGTMLKLVSVLVLIFTFGIGQMWGADSGLTAGYGEFILDFYDSNKLTNTNSGTNLSLANCTTHVKVPTGISASDVITTCSSTGTVRFAMVGGLAWGTGSTSHTYTTLTIGNNFPVRNIKVVAAKWDDIPLYVNSTSVTANAKGTAYANCSAPTNVACDFVTSIRFGNTSGSGTAKKRVALYTAVCEYGYRATITAPATGSITAEPKTANENGAGWNSTLGAVVGLKSAQQVTLTATPPSASYELDSWSVKKTSDNSDVTSTVLGAGNSGVSPVTFEMPAYDVTISATWKLAVSCTNEITISKGTPEHGSFTLTGDGDFCIDSELASATVSNIVPADGYRFKQITTTAGTISGMNITDINADAVINVEFEEIPPFTVSFITGTGNTAQVDIAEASSQSGITLPAGPGTIKCAADGWEFAGWSATNVTSETTSAPTLLTAGTKYYPTDDCTLYAIYTRIVGGSGGAPVGTVMYFEDFSGFSANDVPSSTKTGSPTVYGGGSVTYTSADNGTNKTQIYNNGSVSEAPELLIGKNGGVFTIAGIPLGKASTLTLTYYRNNAVTPTVSGTNVSIGSASTTSVTNKYQATITNSGDATTFDLIFTAGSNNVRFDDVKVVVATTTTAGTAYYISSPDCCTELGSINGSVDMSQTSATLTWDNLDHVAGYAVSYKTGEGEYITTGVGSITTNGAGKKTCTITGLACNTTYDFKIAITAVSGYCDKDSVMENKTTTPNYTYTINNFNVSLKSGETEAANTCSDFMAEYVADDGFALPTSISVDGVSSYEWDNGVLAFEAANVTGNVEVTISGVANTPTFTLTESSLNFGSPKEGDNVAAQTFRISGSALTAGTITISAPSGFSVSPNQLTGITAGELEASAATEITVTPNTSAAGSFDGNIIISGCGVTSKELPVSMTVQETYTVNWYVNGGSTPVHSQTDVANTDYDEIPDDFSAFTDCDPDYHFVGWSETAFGSTTSAPSLATIGTKITADKNYYAVFADGTPGGKAEHSYDLSSSDDNWIATDCEDYFSKPYGMKKANAKIVNKSISDFTSYANTATGISIKVNCFQNNGTGSKMTVSLVDEDGNAIAGTGKEFTPTNTTQISGAGDSEVTYSASEVEDKDATGYMMQLTTKDKNVLVLGTSYEITKPAVYTKWYTTCPHVARVTLSAAEVSNGSISFEQSGSAVTNVRTDGEEDVEVDVVPDPATGYELTGVALSGIDGASYSDGVITIPANAEGTLTATATFAQADYSVTMEQSPAAGATLTGTQDDAHYGATINISTDVPAGYLFKNWTASPSVTFADASATSTSFTMPDDDVTVTANFDRIYTVSEFAALSKVDGTKYVIEGLICNVESYSNSKYITYDISDNGVNSGTTLKIYKGLGLNGASFSAATDLNVGERVRVYGAWDNSHTDINQDSKLYYHQTLSVASVAIGGSAEKTAYSPSDNTFSFAGLTATATYNTGYVKDVTAEATWTANSANPYTVAATGDVTVRATFGGQYGEETVGVTYTSKTVKEIYLEYESTYTFKGMDLPKPKVYAKYVEEIDDDEITSLVEAANGYDTESAYNKNTPDNYTIKVEYESFNAEYTVQVRKIFDNEDAPHNVADAVALIVASAYQSTTSSTDYMWVRGKVSSQTQYNSSYYISDDGTTTGQLYVFNGKYFNNESFTADTKLPVGDEVIVKATILNYNGNTPELTGSKVTYQLRDPAFAFADVVAGDEFEAGFSADMTVEPTSNEGEAEFTLSSGNTDAVTIVAGKLHAVAEGDAVITASRAATDNTGSINYKAKNATFNVHVIAERTRYAITMDANGGSGTDPEYAKQLEGATVDLPATNTYSKANSAFDAWVVTETESGDAVAVTDGHFTMPAAAVTIKATWNDVETCHISFQVSGGEVATAEAPQTVAYSLAEVAHPTVDGFTFLGWSETEYADETTTLPTMIESYTPALNESNKTLYGIYSQVIGGENQHYVLDYTTDVADASIAYSTEVDITATDGSEWVVCASKQTGMQINTGKVAYIKVPDCPANIIQIVLTCNSGAQKAVAFSETSDGDALVSSPYDGTSQTLNFSEVNVSAGYIIPSAGNCQITHIDVEYSGSTTYYTSSPITRYNVTYAKGDATGVTGLCEAQRHAAGTITLCGIPTCADKNFAKWSDGSSLYNAGAEYTLSADVTFTATWTPKPTYSVTYNTSGSTGTTPVDENEYLEGAEVTLASASGLSNAGYVFNGWSDGSQVYAAGYAEYAMPDHDVTFTATWAEISSEKWVLVTHEDALEIDGEYAIVSTFEDNNHVMQYFALGEIVTMGSNKAGKGEAVTRSGNIVRGSTDMVTFTLKEGSASEKYAFKNGDNYLTWSSGNTLENDDEVNDHSSWAITIGNEDDIATIANVADDTRKLQYNSSSPRFACYTSAQKAVQLFKKAKNTVVEDATETKTSAEVAGGDITVGDNGNLTINVSVDKQAEDLTVKNGGKLTLSGDKTLKVNNVYLSATMASGKSSQMSGALAQLDIQGEVYFDITLGANGTNQQWHAFTVPFPVDVMSGIYDKEDNKLTNEVNYAIMEYLGDVRAQGKYGWKKIRTTLVPGTFYIMATDGYRTTYRFKKKAGAALVAANSKPIYEYPLNGGTEADKDNGWNGLGNPNLFYGKVDLAVQVLDPESYTYVTKTANSTNFVVGTPFFYQAAAAGTMVMETADAGANYAPARVQANEIKDVPVSFGNEDFTDYLYISANEDALSTYETGKDLVKMTMTSTPKVAQIFGSAYGNKLCMVHAPMVDDQASYALSLYAPADGTYRIETPTENEDATLYLTKDGRAIWNLSMSACEVELTKGTTENYGLLLVRKAPGVATGNLTPTLSQGEGAKILIDEHVYILRGGQMYDLTGKAVK